MTTDTIKSVLSDPIFLYLWFSQAAVCVGVLVYDLLRNNQQLGSLMKLVWGLTVLYSGLLGLMIYFFSGRWAEAQRWTTRCFGARWWSH